MCRLLLTSVVTLAGLTAAASAETPVAPPATLAPPAGFERVQGIRPVAIKRTVYLDHVVLEELKKSNPEHYAQARRVMARASELCAPNAARAWQVMDGPEGNCSALLLKTSYPPKRQISFVLGETMYIALVTVKDAPALLKAPADRFIPAGTDAPAGIERTH